MRRTLFCFLALCLAVYATASAGSIAGKITYDGNVPKLSPVDAGDFADCAAMHRGGRIPDQSLVLGDGNALGNIFVQVKNAPAGSHRAPSRPVIIEQKGCIYLPRMVGVMAGQPLQFKNSDGILHKVRGLPKVNQGFNLGMPPAARESVTLGRPEPVFEVKCDVHPWMNSYVAVMTHPYFAVTGTDGRFRIDGLPDGTYEVEAWHEKLPAVTGRATVSGGSARLDLTFEAGR